VIELRDVCQFLKYKFLYNVKEHNHGHENMLRFVLMTVTNEPLLLDVWNFVRRERDNKYVYHTEFIGIFMSRIHTNVHICTCRSSEVVA
jgi:hypothetical protein